MDEVDSPSLEKVDVPGFPVHFSEARAGTRKTAPGLGEHTEEILKKLGKYDDQKIEKLKIERVI